ncbi:MAG: SMI1/KNR4 family protein [Polyangiaceae bacterium]|nr:SMI1/KNR4 family protein [Polyangiaceae bacterium]
MKRSTTRVESHLRALRLAPHPGDNGPYDEATISRAEAAIGRRFAPEHREVLSQLGGTFGFRGGAVDVDGTDLNLKKFLGVGDDDFNIVDLWMFFAGQVPDQWYPFAEDHDGDLFLLDSANAVLFVTLDKKLRARSERPKRSGSRVADSFEDFVKRLRAPWFAAELP